MSNYILIPYLVIYYFTTIISAYYCREQLRILQRLANGVKTNDPFIIEQIGSRKIISLRPHNPIKKGNNKALFPYIKE